MDHHNWREFHHFPEVLDLDSSENITRKRRGISQHEKIFLCEWSVKRIWACGAPNSGVWYCDTHHK
jgi:hypothetical protein